jgi:arylsulfatase A-like enzyme
MRSLITITVEGLGTGLVGAYGSNTAITPSIDALAARGIVLDQCFVDSQDLVCQLTSLASGTHCSQAVKRASIWQQCKLANVPSSFITDSATAAHWAEQAGCDQVVLIAPPANVEPEEDPAECAVISLFMAAAELLTSDATGLVWIHSSGLRLAWDAPLALRQQFIDPEDPDPPSEVGPPAFDITADIDPDLVVGWGQVAAAQVAMIDDAIGSLVAVVESRVDATSWTWAIVGLGGVPLGEHGRVGWGRQQLHGEELQCVVVLRPSPIASIGWRRAELWQLPDVAATLFECCALPTPPESIWGISFLEWIPSDSASRWAVTNKLAMLDAGEDGVWIRSPAWSAVLPRCLLDSHEISSELNMPTHAARLYVKPDDQWEVSEVADRCPDIVDQLRRHAVEFIQAVHAHARLQLPELDDQLCNLMR